MSAASARAPLFIDRADAGRRLAEHLLAMRERVPARSLVLGLPRGGVLVAAELAQRLGLELGVWVARKIGAPGNPELAVGAVAPGLVILHRRLIDRLGLSDADLELAIEEATSEVARRQLEWGDPGDLEGRFVLLVDDGVATGATMVAGLRALRRRGAGPLWAVAPVGPSEAAAQLARDADKVVLMEQPENLQAVGGFYLHWPEVTYAEASEALAQARGK